MYSVQHVLWRGAMALSLLVVGGLGAGMSPQSAPASLQNEYACEDTHFVFDGVRGSINVADAQTQLQVFDTVVVKAIHEEA
ncbi:MAG: hypothetical protein HOQ01_06165 [Lysobacter sp.]|nr:hypothetical protein [Lysobacter sp.]